MLAELRALSGITDVYDSCANFILVRIPDAGKVWEKLYERGILVRDFSRSRGLEDCLRLTVGTVAENQELLSALREILG